MSFLEKAGKVTKAVGDAYGEQIEKMKAMRAQLEAKSDDELKKIIKSDGFFGASEQQKKIARIILRERGY